MSLKCSCFKDSILTTNFEQIHIWSTRFNSQCTLQYTEPHIHQYQRQLNLNKVSTIDLGWTISSINICDIYKSFQQRLWYLQTPRALLLLTFHCCSTKHFTHFTNSAFKIIGLPVFRSQWQTHHTHHPEQILNPFSHCSHMTQRTLKWKRTLKQESCTLCHTK